MKILQFIVFILFTNVVFGQENNYFRNAFIELSEDVLKDSLKIATSLNNQKELINNYENKHDLSFENIRVWVSMNYFGDISNIEEEFLQKYFPKTNYRIFNSFENLIKYHENPIVETNDSKFLFMSMEEEMEEEAEEEPHNTIVEKYKELYLDFKKKEFEHSVVLVLSVFSRGYNENIPNLLSTDKFNFDSVIKWIVKNKKEEINKILKPAILEKSFKIAQKSML